MPVDRRATGLTGDVGSQVDILVAGGAADALDLAELSPGEIDTADEDVGLAEIATRNGVHRIEGERLPEMGNPFIDPAHSALRIADHGQHRGIAPVADRLEDRKAELRSEERRVGKECR